MSHAIFNEEKQNQKYALGEGNEDSSHILIKPPGTAPKESNRIKQNNTNNIF
jgi:hypothetical protein